MNPQIHWFKNRCVSLEKSLGTVASRFRALSLVAAVLILFAASAALVSVPAIRGQEKRPPDPWTAAQTIQPADLARELGEKNGTPPTIVYVGFRALFAGGHIPGATFHGSASTEQGLSDLKKWADEIPRTTSLVVVRSKSVPTFGLRSSHSTKWDSRNCGSSFFPQILRRTGLTRAIPFRKGCSPPRPRSVR